MTNSTLKAIEFIQLAVQRAIPAVPHEHRIADIPGWDSLMSVRLLLQIEDRLGRELSEADIESVVTVGDVARLIDGNV